MPEANNEEVMSILTERFRSGQMKPEEEARFRELLSAELASEAPAPQPNTSEAPKGPVGGAAPGVLQPLAKGFREVNTGMAEMLGLRNAASKVGIGLPPEENEDTSVGQMGLRTLGAGAMLAALGVGAGATAAARGVGEAVNVGRGVFTEMLLANNASYVATPGRTAAMEATSAFLAGAGGQAAVDVTDSEGARVVGDLAGSAVPFGATALYRGVQAVSPLAAIGRATVNSFRNLTGMGPSAGIQEAAAERLRRVVPDVDEALSSIEGAQVPSGMRDQFTPAELSESPGLLALEASVVNASEELGLSRAQRYAHINQGVREGMEGAAQSPDDAARVSIEDTRQYLGDLMDTRVQIARDASQERLAAMPGRQVPRERSRVAREEVERALADASTQEDELWALVPKDIRTEARTTRETVVRALQDRNEVRRSAIVEKMPPEVRRFLGTTDKNGQFVPGLFFQRGTSPIMDAKGKPIVGSLLGVDVGSMQSLRSDLLRQIRVLRADDGNRDMINFLSDVQGALLDDMRAIEAVSEPLTLARQFSSDLNEKFRTGVVGRVIGFTRDGGTRIDPYLTLEDTLGVATSNRRSAARSAENVRSLLDATNNSEPMGSSIREYLLDEFMAATVSGDEINAGMAASYIEKRADILDLFPDFRADLEQINDAAQAYALAQRGSNRNQTSTGLILGNNPGREVRSLFTNLEGGRASAEIMAELAADPTGRATRGFQQAIFDELLKDAGTSGPRDVAGQVFVKGSKLKTKLADNNVRRVVDAVLTPEQRKLLNEYANAAAKVERGRQATPSPEELLAFNENMAATLLRRLTGAAVASGVSRRLNLGFGGLVAAQQTNVALDNIAKQGLDPARVLLTEALMGGTTTIRTAGGKTVTRPWLEVLLARPRPDDKVQAQLMEATLRGLTDSLVYNYRLDPGTVYATEEGAPQEEEARAPVAADPRSLRAATQ